MFEGRIGNGFQGDIAIDDVKIVPGACAPIGNCNFELDLCGWQNTNNDNFDWLRSAGATLLRNTGPAVDHTTNSDKGICFFTHCLFGNFACFLVIC